MKLLLAPWAAIALTGAALSVTPALAADSPWIATWATSSATILVNQSGPPGSPTFAATGLTDQTVRQVVATTIGGTSVRLRFSNLRGERAFRVQDVFVGLQNADAAIRKGSSRAVTFTGASSVLVPAGAVVVSDAVPMPLAADQDLVVSFYAPGPTGRLTSGQSGAMSYVAAGNVAARDEGTGFNKVPANALGTALLMVGVDVTPAPAVKGAVVVLGDSLTAGGRSSWPGALWKRVSSDKQPVDMSVLNFALGGVRLLRDSPCFGESTLGRFDEVLALPNVRVILVAIGGNDIRIAEHAGGATPSALKYPQVVEPCWKDRTPVTAADLVGGLQQLVRRAHDHGIKIYWTPITPYTTGASERAVLTAVNEQVRKAGTFDAIFDTATPCTDTSDTWKLTAACDVGDNMHFSPGGMATFAAAIDLNVLRKAVGDRP